jgi:hypothetical protein
MRAAASERPMNFAKGYRTYLIAAVGVGLGVYDALIPYLHLSPIPSWVYVLLGFAGLGAARSGISTDTQKAVGDVLSQITVPAVPAPVTVNVTAAPVADNRTDDPAFPSGPKMAGKI